MKKGSGRGRKLSAGDKVFIEEMHQGHLLVREGKDGRVIACAPLLDTEGAASSGGFHAQREFDITRALNLSRRLLEVGRTWLAPGRDADDATLSALWSGLAREAMERRADFLIGCAGVPFDPETETLTPLRNSLRERWAPEYTRVFPQKPVPRDAKMPNRSTAITPLLSAYLRLGAMVGGEPCWDPQSGIADFFLILPIERLAANCTPGSCARKVLLL